MLMNEKTKFYQVTVDTGTNDFSAIIKFLVLAENIDQVIEKTKHLVEVDERYKKYLALDIIEIKEVSNPDCFDLDITL